MDQIHLSPLVDQIQLTLGHIFNNNFTRNLILEEMQALVSSSELDPSGKLAMGFPQRSFNCAFSSRLYHFIYTIRSENN
jgi:hypothetical protein